MFFILEGCCGCYWKLGDKNIIAIGPLWMRSGFQIAKIGNLPCGVIQSDGARFFQQLFKYYDELEKLLSDRVFCIDDRPISATIFNDSEISVVIRRDGIRVNSSEDKIYNSKERCTGNELMKLITETLDRIM